MTSLQSILDSWTLDEVWLKEAKQKIACKNVSLVTLDIFDTCLTRDVDSPIDIFAKIEQSLLAQNDCGKNFAEARQKAEQLARQKAYHRGLDDITFDEIYNSLADNFEFTPELLTKAKQLELKLEEQSLYAVPDLLALTNYLQKNSIPYSFVSDMYLPYDFLAELLKKKGFPHYQDLIVSGKQQASKASGRIWQAESLQHKTILHIGDNLHSDVEQPLHYGINTLHYDRAHSYLRNSTQLTPHILAFSCQNRYKELELRADPNYKNAPDLIAKRMRILGESIGVLCVGSFIFWLKTQLKKHEISHIAFCARDGYLVQKAWHILKKHDPLLGITDNYLYVSRKSLILAAGYLDSTPQYIVPYIMDFFSDPLPMPPLEIVLKNIGLTSELSLKKAKKMLGSLDKPLSYRKLEKFKQFLNSESHNIYLILEEAHKNLLGYLYQEGFFKHEKIGIIDLGWTGASQKALKRLTNKDLFGFFYGLLTPAEGRRYLTGFTISAFFNGFDTADNLQTNKQIIDFLEEMHRSNEGSTRGYQKIDARYVPLYSNQKVDREQFSEFIAPFQESVLSGLEQLLSKNTFGYLNQECLTIENTQAAFNALILSPQKAELDVLIHLSHGINFIHEPISIASIPQPKKNKHLKRVWMTNWPVATLRYWQLNKTTKNALSFAEFARSNFGYMGPKIFDLFERK